MDVEMIFRDPRFPDVQIRNSGGATFNIWTRGEVGDSYHTKDGWTNTDCFTRYGTANDGNTPEEAKFAAQEHFDEEA
ncbi:hypothetical protein LCGC14_1796200 [marine sediment metagenome]|uniref:Uncharacterized protein n=1 Tax=marine sediment metagenome TaxID=412755 RepID=A0A0F9JQN5_9ZZZZ